MRALCFTVDLDRDVNLKIPGRTAAGSIDRGSGTEPRFSSSEKGLSVLIDLLDEIGMKATFFAEAATLRNIGASLLSGHEVGIHGVDHEDFTLLETPEDKIAVLEEASNTVRDAVGIRPCSFWAPYMSVDEETLRLLPKLGIVADSSAYREISSSFMPEKLECSVWEIPVPEGRDRLGKKISAYLWPMHESKRSPDNYIEMASLMEEGVFTIATHTWHMVESRETGMMSEKDIDKNVRNVRAVLENIADMGMKPLSISEVAKAME
ncbi:MAG: polysaccharide deacetylase family protein [Candidatus Methanoplasma sp.]|jgi:peptidoglycan/xylan/chitin deacetylase (PgdA/CDA1 family)|nr:polysaccharide deacetylase family protein [Candidatus Methanoplasma sp.]